MEGGFYTPPSSPNVLVCPSSPNVVIGDLYQPSRKMPFNAIRAPLYPIYFAAGATA